MTTQATLKSLRDRRDRLKEKIMELRKEPGMKGWMAHETTVQASHFGPTRQIHPVAMTHTEKHAELISMMEGYFSILDRLEQNERASSLLSSSPTKSSTSSSGTRKTTR